MPLADVADFPGDDVTSTSASRNDVGRAGRSTRGPTVTHGESLDLTQKPVVFEGENKGNSHNKDLYLNWRIEEALLRFALG